MIRRSISSLGQQFNSFADNLSTIRESLNEIIVDHEVVDIRGAKDLNIVNGEIRFENISFNYGDREIFKDLSLSIKAGERIGLIGKSGAGKSTLVKLLTRQYDLNGGHIMVDSQDISHAQQESLREAIATVPQEPLLFHRTIKENISYGNPSASEGEIIIAANQAQAHNFISAIPTGYETLVGERGIKLSGGEKQRVAIARAFLKKSKILLLDEATSALDSESEILIQQALEKLMEGKTVIAIAHRLSTLRAMDRLIVMDGGRIVEDGSHEELIKKGGIYAGLWSHQAGGFIKED
ncbi:MAG: ATP-binding cassette domain-containing protein, partial [Patescibacteria group bacterium]